ncbi:SDR family NAD(P)-dependent oxidoreductase [Ramlibacter tataouinensis]|uniref:SDR family NAD(P)-dependent oxidoreductase n=1 Tax=Ramlibacter tataouinensis TaxID=94132 RepID=UPI000776B0AE|nr:SDR family oxidoreductase [Ramlibacter tataouinensis]
MNGTDRQAFPWRDLRVAVTGGTSGLGLALVQQFQAAGARVAFIARDPQRVSAVAQRCPGTHGIAGDVADKASAHPLALQVSAALGGLDILVNNASVLGPVPLAPLADTECEDFEAALEANLLGPFRLTKALLGMLASSARQGRPAIVVNISSDAAVNAYPNWGAYGASKAALAHMSRIWDLELRGHGIRVIEHEPGDMDTPMHAAALPEADPATLKPPAQAARELLERLAPLARAQRASLPA